MFPKIAASSLFAALSVVSVVAGAEFTICKQGYANIESLSIPVVKAGGEACINVEGSIDRRIEGGIVSVTALNNLNIAIFNKEFKLCSEIQDISCPIPEGKHKFSKCIKVPPEAYPDMTVSVHASARDQNGDTIFCVGKSVTVQE